MGSQGVGKTSIIFRLSMSHFKPNITPTIGASFSCKVLDIDSYTIRFQIWDTAGQETYKSMLPMYYRKTNLAMVVFDITCAESFNSIPSWIEELEKHAERDCIICIIGNKSDLENKRAVDRNRAAYFARSVGALYFETSAKTNEGITETFQLVARQLINLYHRRGSFVSSVSSSTRSQSQVILEPEQRQRKKGCCT